ncbi:MAG TPA: SDR family oxidoreductase [Ktedonobacteraceae bacterium]
MTLKGKVALVTGAGGSGVGAATARELAERGARVIVNYRSNKPAAQAVVDAIVATGGEARAIQADVLDEEQVVHMVAEAIETYGQIDILVNSKGGQPLERTSGGWAHSFRDMTWEELEARVNGELRAAFNVTKAVVPIMERQHYGRLVYVSSEHSRGPAAPGMMANGTAKAGLNTFVVYLAHELGPLGITANVVSPGMVLSEETVQVVPMEFRKRVVEATPLRRATQPEDVARVIAFFASDDSALMTGVYAPVTGGVGLARL